MSATGPAGGISLNDRPRHTERQLPDPVVTAASLTKRYGEVVAVDDVTFSLAAGTVTGFLGPNGAGKTTTLAPGVGLVLLALYAAAAAVAGSLTTSRRDVV